MTEDVNTPIEVEVASPVPDLLGYGRVATPRSKVDAPRASLGLIIGGFVALLLSAWAGIVPFLGPTFGFSDDHAPSWTWDKVHLFAALVPGAVGLVASWVVLNRARRAGGRLDAVVVGCGLLLLLSGAWLTVAPVVWPAVVGPYLHATSAKMTLAYWLGYSSGPGVLLVAFGGFAMGRTIGGSTRGPAPEA